MPVQNLMPVEVSGTTPNPYGQTKVLGKFEELEIIVPPIVTHFPFGNTFLIYFNDRLVWSGDVPHIPVTILINLPPYARGCCWQSIQYRVNHGSGSFEHSEYLHLLIETD